MQDGLPFEVLVDQPDLPCRRLMSLERSTLTNLRLDAPRLFKKTTMKTAPGKNDVFAKFRESDRGKKLAAAREKTAMTDLDSNRTSKRRFERTKKIRQVYDRLEKGNEL